MATKKPIKDKKPFIKPAEYDKFFSYIGKARVMAYQLSKDTARSAEVRRAMSSIEKKLWNIGNDYYWGRMTDYMRP